MSCIASNSELQEWIQHNIKGLHEDPEWPEKFVITLWYILKWRCDFCFDNAAAIAAQKGEFLMTRFQEILTALKQDMQWLNAPREECL